MNKLQFFLTCILFCSLFAFATPRIAKAATAVTIESIDYDDYEIKIALNGNTKIFYSDSSEKTWYEVEGKQKDGYINLDISWINASTDYTLKLKGNEKNTVVSVILPARNNSLTVKFDELEGMLVFTNEEYASTFQWRKSTSYNWSNTLDIGQSSTAANKFLDEIEAMRVSGAKIYVRLPQTEGTSASNPGERSSKEVLVTIPKRASAPKVALNFSKLTLSTNSTMEYKIYSVGGVLTNDSNWISAESAMKLEDIVPSSAKSNTSILTKNIVILFRTAETEKKSYSKTQYLSIPSQAVAPTEIIESYSTTKYSLTFTDASKQNPYEYVVVKPGVDFDITTASWKSVISNKPVYFTNKSTPVGSKIYVRYKGTAQSSTVDLKLPSCYNTFTVNYKAETTN